ncbi:hypothetical protein A6A04_11300 [Paramagnetospirillum marisnigri]|uniref:Ribonuclease VapC n=1 Tax=Paramagnetospirillum marisnigri TaxID=1285242 RepID=A0A178MWN1_9PROT|nr:type II toxin-antitoxin system VapC family toxin [Paramagnetospirillum marisnigri]OAN55240.1 hypothetical protein A6A04_11300 [Paramagnetospirillum marisnigri]
MTLVIDASVAMKWLVDGEGADRAQRLIGIDTLAAPDLIFAEVANALWRYTAQGLLPAAAGATAISALRKTLDQSYPLGDLAPRAYAIAAELNHPAYDCCYLALAEMLDAPLITADRRLAARGETSPFQNRVRLL